MDIPTETNVYMVDNPGADVDEDVFSEILDDESDVLWTIMDVCSVNVKLQIQYILGT